VPAAAHPDGSLVLRRVRRRLIPFAFICYVVAYIDRVNIGFAATELQRDLHLSPSEYGLGAGLFFLAYCLFEIPSNLILERVGARRWIARILIGWGVVSMGTALVTDVRSFMLARVLLGIAEAGFFPGMVLYLTYWIPARERAKTGAWFMMAAPIAVIVGGPLSEALLTLDGRMGLAGWQWLFLVEGVPAVVLGVFALRVLTDRPEQADWLRAADREWLTTTMAAEQVHRQSVGHATIGASITSPRVWILSGVLFMHTLVQYGIFLWLPKMLQDVSGARGFALSAITAIPFAAALVAMVLVGRHSDRTGERKFHVAACAVVSAVGLLLAVAAQGHLWLLVLSFTISQMAQRSMAGVFWALPPMFLGGTAAAAGLGLINATGNLGGFFGPTVMGWLREATGGYTGGLLVLAAALIIEVGLVLMLRVPKDTGTGPVQGS
jgi:MFS family permease